MSSKYETRGEDEPQRGLVALSKSIVLQPVHIALSKPARRAYLTTVLIAATGILLLGFAITAYTLFYLSYIPRIGFERTIHLQFDNVFDPSDSRHTNARNALPYPYGEVTLSPDLVSAQRYDVAVELSLPRTPSNTEAGNFMLEVNMYAPQDRLLSVVEKVQAGLASGAAEPTPLASSRRPAILPYRSAPVELAYRFTELHWYLLNWRQEADFLRVDMFESVEFAKGWRNVPSTLRLELQSIKTLQVYSAKVMFRARFRGLRWLIYNHRVTSAIFFISSFWITEVLFAGVAWATLTMLVFPATEEGKAEELHEVAERIKEDPDEDATKLSDTERVFPTLSGQQTLRFASPQIKEEEDDEAGAPMLPTPGMAAEADDEYEDMDFFDSGLGTSMESSNNRRDSIRKRRGRASVRDET